MGREKFQIPRNKRFIALKGEGMLKTKIVWDDHDSLLQSANFCVLADDFVAANIGFTNSYNHVAIAKNPRIQAVAALINGDRASFYNCSFYGLQDTLWDNQGRHYFKDCFIEDHRPQKEQRLCSKNAELREMVRPFWDELGDHIQQCYITNHIFSDVVVPDGLDAWTARGQEHNTMYAEHNNHGPGSNTSKRVPWMRKLDNNTLKRYTDLSFINSDWWIQSQPRI
ncbi:Pectinesterase, catalytic [Dillenia turbinata]|uniref:pectinesterase n=1 Tax=Dillenia turbinata TaxID=194707 RepID=A0AAN8VAE9_9MAGN